MTALRITALYPCACPAPTKDIDEQASQPENAAMHADVLAATTPSPQTKTEALRSKLLIALDAAQAPTATTADQVVNPVSRSCAIGCHSLKPGSDTPNAPRPSFNRPHGQRWTR